MAEWGSPDHLLHAKHGQLHRYRKADALAVKEALQERSALHAERDALINGLNRANGETVRHIDSEIERVEAEIARIDEFIISMDADLREELDDIKRRLDEHDISISGFNIMIDHLTERIDQMMETSENDWFSDTALAKRRRPRRQQS